MSSVEYLNVLFVKVSTLQHVLDNIDPTCADSHLLMAQIQLHQGNFLNAQQSLEVGLSYNFEVREHPIYHLINAKVSLDTMLSQYKVTLPERRRSI